MYELALDRLRIDPGEALVVEDSEAGLAAARAAGTHVMSVANPTEVNFYRVMLSVRAAERLTLVVPAAGDGKRFAEVGYVYPKPLIDVEGRPMLCHAVDDFMSLDPRIVTIMQRDHVREFAAREVLDQHYPGIEVVEVERKTEGAACTVLLAEPYLNWDAELVLANSDQTVDVDLAEFIDAMRSRRADAGILTFRDTNPKWSFARTDATGRVLEVAEKRPISDQATVGIYYFRRAGDFIRGARQMIAKDVRVNGEFYVCPVFNELISAGLSVFVHQIERSAMNGLGTPEDLLAYLDRPRDVRQLRRAA
jgi:dTDP-glucose pyrophosphorylase